MDPMLHPTGIHKRTFWRDPHANKLGRKARHLHTPHRCPFEHGATGSVTEIKVVDMQFKSPEIRALPPMGALFGENEWALRQAGQQTMRIWRALKPTARV